MTNHPETLEYLKAKLEAAKLAAKQELESMIAQCQRELRNLERFEDERMLIATADVQRHWEQLDARAEELEEAFRDWHRGEGARAMTVRNSFAENFGEDQAAALEAAANHHDNGINSERDRGSDPFNDHDLIHEPHPLLYQRSRSL